MQTLPLITYNLTLDDRQAFYPALSRFTDAWLVRVGDAVARDVNAYRQFISDAGWEAVRSREEYLLEYLAIGVFLQQYGDHARHADPLVVDTLIALATLRRQYPEAKPAIDETRGVLMSKLLSPAGDDAPSGASTFAQLVRWLEAAGDFREEAIRLAQWQRYLDTLDGEAAADILARADRCAGEFRELARQALGPFTAQVGQFLQQQHPEYRDREDSIFRGRAEVEYHMNMVGAELLNRALRARFARTGKRAVLLPTCMCDPGGEACQARHHGLEITCTACTPSCRVNALRAALQEANVRTFLIPHASSFSQFLAQWQGDPEIGLVGVACVLNLLTGGYEMMKLGIASQCVFLNYSGCQRHWHPDGIPTDLDAHQLLTVATAKAVDVP